MDVMLIVRTLIACAIAYVLCGVSSGLIIGKRFYDIDLREHGSGNLGFTNAIRVIGVKPGIAVLVLDILKGVVGVLLGILIVSGVAGPTPWGEGFYHTPQAVSLGWVYLSCELGHVYSPYLNFKGGKGIATGLGGALVLIPWAGIGSLSGFLVLAIATGYVSLGSLFAAASLPVIAAIAHQPSFTFLIPIILVGIVVLWAHRDNAKRLVHKEERRFSIKRKVK